MPYLSINYITLYWIISPGTRMRISRFLLTSLIFLALTVPGLAGLDPGNPSINAPGMHLSRGGDVNTSQAKQMIDSDPDLVILDVRNQSDFDAGHLRHAYLIPHDEVKYRTDELDKNDTILIYCNTGFKSSLAYADLEAEGFSDIWNMLEGITNWTAQGWPVYIPYGNLQQTIDAANPGDALYLGTKQYLKGVILNKTLTLIGEDKNTTSISLGEMDVYPICLIISHATHCNISDLGFYGASKGISAYMTYNLSIRNCSFSNIDTGILLDRTNLTKLRDNTFTGPGIEVRGDELVHWNTHDIDDSNKVNEGAVHYISGVETLFLENISGQVIIADSISVFIRESNFTHTSVGVSIGFCWGIQVDHCNINNNSYGIKVYKSDWNDFEYNTIANNTKDGVFIDSSEFNLIKANTIGSNSGFAVHLTSTSRWCDVVHNIIIENNLSKGSQARDDGQLNSWNWNSSWEGGNYWSDWREPDLNKDGIIDIPYNISGNADSMDERPLWILPGIPLITTQDIPVAFEDEQYSVEYKVFDADECADHIWNLSTNADWLNLDYWHVLSGIPLNSDVGIYWVNISATDIPDTDFHNFTLTVLNTNDPPNITTPDVQSIMEDQFYLTDYDALDIDPTNDTLTWSLGTDADWLSMGPDTGVLKGIPDNDDVGVYWVNVSVDDGNDGNDFTNFTLTVFNVNDAPVITTSPLTDAYEDRMYEADFNGTDPDPTNETLLWSVVTNAGFLNMEGATGVLWGMPWQEDVGTYWVNVTVGDGLPGTVDSLNFSLTVHPMNDPPEGRDLEQEVNEDCEKQLIDLDTLFTDLDGDTRFTYSVLGSQNLEVQVYENLLEYKPKENWNGWENLTVIASDGEGVGGSSIQVHVLPVNDPPASASILLVTIDQTTPITEKSGITLLASVQDVDVNREGDVYTYLWSSNISGVLGTNKDLEEISLEPGHHRIVMNATDKVGCSVETHMDLYVQDSTDIPGHLDDDDTGKDEGSTITSILVISFIIFIVVAVMVIFLFILVKSREEEEDEDLDIVYDDYEPDGSSDKLDSSPVDDEEWDLEE